MTSTIEVSCFYLNNNIYESINFTFIKYEKFMKICVQEKVITILIEKLKHYEIFYNIYILSLLCSKDTSQICQIIDEEINCIKYGVLTKKNWNGFYFYKDYDVISLESNSFRNPFLSREPKRETSFRKQNKVLKLIRNFPEFTIFPNSFSLIDMFISDNIKDTEIIKLINYEKKIYLLCCIRHMNIDIYHNIMKFMKFM